MVPRAPIWTRCVRARDARDVMSRAVRARGHRADRDPTDEKNARDSTQIAFPFGDRPAWLDGSLPGDRGFDPFELGKKSEYLQFSPDSLDGSAAKNPSGNVIGKVKATDNKPKARALAVRARAHFWSSRSRSLVRRSSLARCETVVIIHRIWIAPAIA